MALYIIFYFLVGLLGFLQSRLPSNQKNVVVLMIFLLLALFAGFRGAVGSDTLNYLEIYQNSPDLFRFFESQWTVEPGFLFLNSLHKFFFNSNFLYLFGYSVFQALLVMHLYKKSNNPAIFIIVYVVVFYLNFNFNILRAGTATLLLLLALNSKKSLMVIFYFAIGLSFHLSIIVALPLLLVGRNLPVRKLIFCYLSLFGLTLGVVITFSDKILYKIFRYINYMEYSGSYPIVLLFTTLVFIGTIVVRKSNLPSIYIFSGLLLIASLMVTFFLPGFYRVTLIFLFLYFWYLIQYFRRFISLYSLIFCVFFLYHAVSSIILLGSERERLEKSIATTVEPRAEVYRDALKTTYIPYKFYWEDF